jgi:hypothetical protein
VSAAPQDEHKTELRNPAGNYNQADHGGFNGYYAKRIMVTMQKRRSVVPLKYLVLRLIRLIRFNPFNRFILRVSVFLLLAVKAQSQSIEARIDAITAGPAAIHAGAGFTVPMGTYVRSGFDAAIGSSNDGISGRFDGFARFHLDPLRQHKWAPYGGGGLTARFDDNRSTRYYLLVLLGIDGPVTHRMSTSIEAGLGGGARLGVVVRRAAERR